MIYQETIYLIFPRFRQFVFNHKSFILTIFLLYRVLFTDRGIKLIFGVQFVAGYSSKIISSTININPVSIVCGHSAVTKLSRDLFASLLLKDGVVSSSIIRRSSTHTKLSGDLFLMGNFLSSRHVYHITHHFKRSISIISPYINIFGLLLILSIKGIFRYQSNTLHMRQKLIELEAFLYIC